MTAKRTYRRIGLDWSDPEARRAYNRRSQKAWRAANRAPDVAPPGRPPKLTPEQKASVLRWHKERGAFGTMKSKARELGVCVQTLHNLINSPRRHRRAPNKGARP